jgi:hypothetical protein
VKRKKKKKKKKERKKKEREQLVSLSNGESKSPVRRFQTFTRSVIW